MTKLSFGTHPFLLGFEQLERLVERTAKSSEGYPPFNIEATSENAYRITLAVAGFREEDLAITVEDRQLVVRGRQAEETGERVYLHRGIASRAFQRSFVLADGVEVAGASMEHGLLHIDLKRAVPETVVQTIAINSGSAGQGAAAGPNPGFQRLPQSPCTAQFVAMYQRGDQHLTPGLCGLEAPHSRRAGVAGAPAAEVWRLQFEGRWVWVSGVHGGSG